MMNRVESFCRGEVYERARDEAANEIYCSGPGDLSLGESKLIADIVLKTFFKSVWDDAKEQDDAE